MHVFIISLYTITLHTTHSHYTTLNYTSLHYTAHHYATLHITTLHQNQALTLDLGSVAKQVQQIPKNLQGCISYASLNRLFDAGALGVRINRIAHTVAVVGLAAYMKRCDVALSFIFRHLSKCNAVEWSVVSWGS
jgi:hypothetical protein